MDRMVQVQDRVAVEADVACGFDKELDGVLVIQDHLGVFGAFTFGALPGLDYDMRVEDGIGIPSRRLEFHDRSMSRRFRICRA